MLSKITYSQIEFIKIIMNCNFDISFTDYNFIQKSIFISYARDAQGNVMATYEVESSISNYFTTNRTVTPNYYTADVVSFSDYYPFGMLMPNRHGQSENYRYGYQGSEKDNEVHGQNGSSYTTHFRQLDTRIGRWLSRDPLANKFPWQSPYVSMDNNPIKNNDKNGDKVPVTGKKEAQNKLLKQVNEKKTKVLKKEGTPEHTIKVPVEKKRAVKTSPVTVK